MLPGSQLAIENVFSVRRKKSIPGKLRPREERDYYKAIHLTVKPTCSLFALLGDTWKYQMAAWWVGEDLVFSGGISSLILIPVPIPKASCGRCDGDVPFAVGAS